MAVHARKCKHCGDKFLARNAKGTFCTSLCGTQWRRAEERKQQTVTAVHAVIDEILEQHK